ncbi:Putative uncharacterized protein [Moritella viscosa]|nr:Putative uncharacterized protein [Moritella viscosa]
MLNGKGAIDDFIRYYWYFGKIARVYWKHQINLVAKINTQPHICVITYYFPRLIFSLTSYLSDILSKLLLTVDLSSQSLFFE